MRVSHGYVICNLPVTYRRWLLPVILRTLITRAVNKYMLAHKIVPCSNDRCSETNELISIVICNFLLKLNTLSEVWCNSWWHNRWANLLVLVLRQCLNYFFFRLFYYLFVIHRWRTYRWIRSGPPGSFEERVLDKIPAALLCIFLYTWMLSGEIFVTGL